MLVKNEDNLLKMAEVSNSLQLSNSIERKHLIVMAITQILNECKARCTWLDVTQSKSFSKFKLHSLWRYVSLVYGQKIEDIYATNKKDG